MALIDQITEALRRRRLSVDPTASQPLWASTPTVFGSFMPGVPAGTPLLMAPVAPAAPPAPGLGRSPFVPQPGEQSWETSASARRGLGTAQPAITPLDPWVGSYVTAPASTPVAASVQQPPVGLGDPWDGSYVTAGAARPVAGFTAPVTQQQLLLPAATESGQVAPSAAEYPDAITQQGGRQQSAMAIGDPWAGSYVSGSAAGVVTAQPGVLPAQEALGNALDVTNQAKAAGAVDLVSPALEAAAASANELNNNPQADLRQLPREAQVRQRGPALQRPGTVRAPRLAGPSAAAGIAEEAARRGAAVGGIGYTPADFGLGQFIVDKSQSLAGRVPAGRPGAGVAIRRVGQLLGAGARALPYATAALPAVMGAVDGAQDGVGGAVIQGGASAAGSAVGAALGTFIGGPGFGTVIGAGLGGMAGNALGGGVRGAAVSAVNRAQGGDTGVMGQIGRALDPLIDTPTEREAMLSLQQLNSPAMVAIRQQEELRRAKERADMAHSLLMQSYARGLG